MKKVFALLLALAMILPMGLVASADGEVTVQPFYVLGWSDFDEVNYPYLNGLVTSSFTNIGDRAVLSYGGGKMINGQYTEDDVLAVATALKKTMDSRPAGARYWHLFGPAKIIKLAPDNVINLDHGIVQLKEMFTAVINKMAEIGCPLDGVVVDTEYVGMSSYYIYADTDHQENNAQRNKLVYNEIVNEPRYQTYIRPELEKRGFVFYDKNKISPYTPEIYGISGKAGAAYDTCRSIWDAVIRNYLNEYVNEWCYYPLRAAYPEASLSDYQSTDSATWLKMAAVTDSGEVMTGGNTQRVGTASCYSYYYSRPNADFYKNNQKYAGYNDAIFAAEPFSNLLYDINFTRHMFLSTDTRQIAPWITYYTYGGQEPQSAAYTPYYSELIYHLGMFDPEPFLSYTYVGDSCFSDGRENSEHYKAIQQVKNELMAELTRVAGYSDRKPIELPQNWNSKFVLSGMYANGRNIWRITPNTNVISVEDFKLDAADPTFRVNGETVTFPGGKIIADSTISKVGTCGYWVETAANVTPIVTADADRYDKYPALKLDFENSAEGTFDYNSCKPFGAWEFTWKKFGSIKGETKIVTVDGNKKLAIIGNSANRLVNLPNNITAGDTFADDQSWQITVTIPEGLSAETEIVILKYAGNKQKVADGGFKVQGGKLYYSEEGAYKELMDIAPGTYTFKRTMNFNNKADFSCDYAVYDASGAVLKSVAGIKLPEFNYITSIEFSCAKSDKEILFDEYKLCVTGVAADFGLYDAETGMYTTSEVRPAATAYRLSWLNATAEAKKATIKADIYEGETLKETLIVEEINLLPGTDGIETGIVKVEEGQSVKVYIEADFEIDVDTGETPEEPEEEEPTTPPATEPTTEPTADPAAPTTAATTPATTADAGTTADEGGNTMMIVLIAVVVVAIGAVVAALALTKKKK